MVVQVLLLGLRRLTSLQFGCHLFKGWRSVQLWIICLSDDYIIRIELCAIL